MGEIWKQTMTYHRIRLILIIQLCGRMFLFLGDDAQECNVTMSVTYHQFFRKILHIHCWMCMKFVCMSVHCTVLSIFLHDWKFIKLKCGENTILLYYFMVHTLLWREIIFIVLEFQHIFSENISKERDILNLYCRNVNKSEHICY